MKLDPSTAVQPQPSNSGSSSKTDLSVRAPSQPRTGLAGQAKATAGSQWFDLPKTELTPEFKRDWQLLRMRGILDPKHQKKALRASAPEYSHVGEIIAGPTEFYSARLTRKESLDVSLYELFASVWDGPDGPGSFAAGACTFIGPFDTAPFVFFIFFVLF